MTSISYLVQLKSSGLLNRLSLDKADRTVPIQLLFLVREVNCRCFMSFELNRKRLISKDGLIDETSWGSDE